MLGAVTPLRMPESMDQQPPLASSDDRVGRLEARLARIEARLGLDFVLGGALVADEPAERRANDGAVLPGMARAPDELEQRVGQSGFAVAGVIVLTIGIGFMLSQPYPKLPIGLPPAAGIALATGLLLAAHFGQRTLGALAVYVRGAAMVLLYLATLRLFFFGRQPVLGIEGVAGRALLVLVVALNAFVAWRRHSPWLVLLALIMGCATIIVVNAGGFLVTVLPMLAVGVMLATRWRVWPAVLLAGIPLIYATYFVWAIGNPLRGGRYHFMGEPAIAPGILIAIVCTFAAGSLFRSRRDPEDGVTNSAALLNSILGYGCFLVHTAAVFPRSFAALHAAAFVVFLGTAVLFWIREKSRVSTSFYALTGYVALSMTILEISPTPEVFVWLSLQSVVVVTTAIWFRSRLIVVANFLIYTAIVVGYMLLVERETGISMGFGLVALVSARILNWQKDRLELKTELMRNAYLISAFIVFPYALYHLVASRYVALAWVGLAVGYYMLNLIVRSPKNRWMGHGTLGLAALYLALAGAGRIEPVYRVASFLALGTVLLIVSLWFKARARVR